MPQIQTGYLNLNDGGKLHYEVAGEGHPLVLAHAGVADLHMWDDQFAEFAKHYRVVRYDMRGWGKSTLGTGAFLHREDLAVLLDHLKIDRAYLMGDSHGGDVIIDFVLEHPERVAALIPVAAASNGYEMQGDPPPQILEMMPAMERGDLERVAELHAQLFVDGLKRTPDQSPQDVRAKLKDMTMIGLQNMAFLHGDEPALNPPAAHRWSEIKCPTLVIVGDYDNPAIVQAGDEMAAAIPDAKMVTIHEAAHLPGMEKPADFNKAVLDFLAQLG